MSAASAQGVIRYAVMVDSTQADRAIATYKNNLTSLAGPTSTASRNLQAMNQQFVAGVNPIKTQGNALTTYNNNLKATQTQAISLGTRIKTTAGNFAGFATGLSTTTSGILSLNAGFRDYGDSQIAVDKATRKLSVSQEAANKAHEKLNTLTKSGIKSGQAFEQATLDVAQAEQKLAIDTQLVGERQEDMFDAQTQFVASVIPVTLGAVGTLGSAFKDLGLNMTKIKSTFTTVGTGATALGNGFTGLVSKLTSLGSGADVATGGFGKLGKAGTGIKGIFASLGGGIAGLIPSITGIGTKSGDATKGLGTLGTAAAGLGGKLKGIGTTITASVLPAMTSFITGGAGLTGLKDKLKGATTSATGFAGSVAAIGLAAGAGAIGAAIIIDQVQKMGDEADKAGAKFTKMTNGLLFSPDEAIKGFEQWNELMEATGLSVQQLQTDWDGAVDKFVAAGGKLDNAGNIIWGSFTKAKNAAAEATAKTNELTAAENKLSDDQAKLAALQKERQTTSVKGEIENMKAVIENDKAKIASLKTEAARLAALEKTTGAIKDQTKSIDDMSSTFATIAVRVGAFGKDWVDVGNNVAFTTHQTDPYNKSLAQTNALLPEATVKFGDLTASVSDLAKQFPQADTVVLKTKSTILGLGDTIDNIIKKFAEFKEIKVVLPSFPSANANLIRQVPGPIGGNPAARDSTQEQKQLDVLIASRKKYVQTVRDTVAANTNIQATVKALNAIEKEHNLAIEAANKLLQDHMNIAADSNAEDNKLLLTFKGLSLEALHNADVRAKLLSIEEKQKKGHEAEELSILDLAAANDVYSGALANLADQEGDQVTQMNNLLGASINYTSALTDQAKNQKLVSEGFRDGVIQAKTFFDDLVKGTQQELTFNESLVKGAKQLGITSSLYSFSSAKMQELITTTYKATTANNDLGLSAAKSTAFLKDEVLIMAQVREGTMAGTIAANEWAISNTKATAEAFAFHEQLLQVTADMTGLTIPIGTSNEALQKMMTTFEQTENAGLAFAEMMTAKLEPAFQRMSGLIQSKDMKALRDGLKKMELPPGFNKDLDDAFKPLRGAAEEARQLGNAMDILVVAGENMSKKDLAKNMKAFGNELDRVSKIKGTNSAVDALLMSLKKMTPSELDMHSESMAFLTQTIDEFGQLRPDQAEKFIQMFNEESKKIGPNANTAAAGVDKLSSAFATLVVKGSAAAKQLEKAEAAFNPANFTRQPDTPKGNKVFKSKDTSLFGDGKKGIDVDNRAAIKAVDVIAKRIDSLSTIHPVITLQNATAIRAIDVIAVRINSLTGIQPQITLANNQAIKVVDVVAKRIDSLTGIQPSISLQNKQAIKTVDVIAKRIDSLTKIEPQISLQNKQAIKVVDVVAKRIDSLEKIKPSIQVSNTEAMKRVDAVAKRIDSLSKLNPTINVKVNVQGMPKGAAHGMHETLTEDTLIQAHKGERVDIQRSNMDDTSMRSLGASGNRPPAGMGSSSSANLTVNNIIDLGGDTIVRSFKRRLGNNMFAYGG